MKRDVCRVCGDLTLVDENQFCQIHQPPAASAGYRPIEIQNALRVIAHVANNKTLLIDGDLVYCDGSFIGRTQEAAEVLGR